MDENTFYDRYYYLTSCGLPYDQKDQWEAFFGQIADKIVQEINPRTVLDAGCAYGYLVAALRNRGVEAFGIDISSYAISQVPDEIRPYCKVASVLDPLDQKYDLIISIEVLEHLQENESRAAVENLCNYTGEFVFASTPTDFKEATHFNVQPTEYWVRLFAQRGFYRDLNFEPSFIVEHAIRFKKVSNDFNSVIADYERAYYKKYTESKAIRNELVSARAALAKSFDKNEIVIQAKTSDLVQQKQAELNGLSNAVQQQLAQVSALQLNNQALAEQVTHLEKALQEKDRLLNQLWGSLKELDQYHLKQLNLNADQLKVIIDEKQSAIALLEQSIKQSNQHINQLTNILEVKDDNLHNVNQQLEHLTQTLKAREEELKNLSETDEDKNRLEESLNEVKQINAYLKEKLTESYKSREDKDRMIYELNKEINNIKQQNNSLFQEGNASITELNRIRALKGFKLLWKYYKVRDTFLLRNSGGKTVLTKSVKDYEMFKNLFKGTSKQVEQPTLNETPETTMPLAAAEPIANVPEVQEMPRADTILELEKAYFSNNPIYNVKFAHNPLISVVVAVFNTPIDCLNEMILSVLNQTYTNFELVILNASAENLAISESISHFVHTDERVVYKNIKNSGIAGNTNEGVKVAKGEFIALLDHDDIITPNALYEVVSRLQEDPQAVDFFYSDKDMMLADGRTTCNPLYKPQWSPEIMLSANYLTHFCIIRKSLIEASGMLDSSTDGSQDWDIFLKVSRLTDKICHVPEKLYHWRIIPTSVASGIGAKPYALKAQVRSIQNHFNALNYNATVKFEDEEKHLLKVEWHHVDVRLVSFIINHTGSSENLHHLLQQISNFKDYPAQIQVVTQNDLSLADYPHADIIKSKASNLYANLNVALESAKGDVFIFMESGATFTNDNAIKELITWAAQEQYGAVTPKLVGDNQMILSTGIVINGDHIVDSHQNAYFIHYSCFGSSEWYRNVTAVRTECFAVKSKLLKNAGWFNADYEEFSCIDLCLHLSKLGLRHVYNPFSVVQISGIADLNHNAYKSRFQELKAIYKIPPVDKYWNKNLQLNNPIPTENARKVNKLASLQTGNANAVTGWEKYSADAISIAINYDFSESDLQKNGAVMNNNKGELDITTTNWFLPPFEYIYYAGLYTIFRLANHMRSVKNVHNTFVIVGGSEEMAIYDKIVEAFPALAGSRVVFINSLSTVDQVPYADASVCSFWTTAYYLLRFNNTRRKFYFIQDFEPLFYPAGSTYGQTEATYKFNFYGITNTQALKNLYERDYNGRAIDLKPSIDYKVFYPKKKVVKDEVKRVFFYGRPGHPRNGFELGSAALKILKTKLQDGVEIYCAGSDWDPADYDLAGIVTNIGRMDFEQTGDLYRVCDVGLVMMFTKHPSYLPFELMACGCAVVSNFNEATTWFLKNGENCLLTEASATRIAESIEKLLLNDSLRNTLIDNAVADISANHTSWSRELDSIYNYMCTLDNVASKEVVDQDLSTSLQYSNND